VLALAASALSVLGTATMFLDGIFDFRFIRLGMILVGLCLVANANIAVLQCSTAWRVLIPKTAY
jgi:hypothetical protein